MDQLAKELEIVRLFGGQSWLDNLENLLVLHILNFEGNLVLYKFLSLLKSLLESFDDIPRMNSLLDAPFCLAQKLPAKSDNKIGPISVLIILNLGAHVNQIGSRVMNINLL